jgi:hypothetical protein
MRQEWQRRRTYQQINSIFRIQCKLNLQTDRFNLRRVLTDELTNRSVRGLGIGENELANILV